MVNGESMKYTYCDSLHKNQCVDKNGNCELAENLNNCHAGNARSILAGKETDDDRNVKPQIDQKAISRLQAMAMSDDDDYGETFTWNSESFLSAGMISCLWISIAFLFGHIKPPTWASNTCVPFARGNFWWRFEANWRSALLCSPTS